jgi:hypothetical protein
MYTTIGNASSKSTTSEMPAIAPLEIMACPLQQWIDVTMPAG